MPSSFLLDPNANLDYEWDWTDWLAVGETITAHTITPPTGITVGTHAVAGSKVVAWLTGVVGTKGRVVCHIVTSAGRTDDRSITVTVQDR